MDFFFISIYFINEIMIISQAYEQRSLSSSNQHRSRHFLMSMPENYDDRQETDIILWDFSDLMSGKKDRIIN